MQIAGFDSLTEIGRGGFGVVYRAPQPGFGRDVAIKVLSAPALQRDERARRRFERETATTGTLSSHPHIVTLHQAGFTDDDRPYLVMALLEGGSLGDRLARSGPMPWQEVLPIGVKVAGALATAHAAGIIHRDVKPDNVLVDDFGAPVLSDFGIASATGIDGAQLTATGQLTVTVAYSPPEVLDGARPDERTDVFALGATLFALLTGHPPFARPGDETVARIMARMVSEDAPDLAGYGVPRAVADAIAGALTRDPEDRTPTAVALGEALQAALTSLGEPAVAMVLPRSVDIGGEAERTLALPDLDLSALPGTDTPGDAAPEPEEDGPSATPTAPLGSSPATTPTAALPAGRDVEPPRTPTTPLPAAAPVPPTAPTPTPVEHAPVHQAAAHPAPSRRSRRGGGLGAAVAGILVGLAILTVAGVAWLVLADRAEDAPATVMTGAPSADPPAEDPPVEPGEATVPPAPPPPGDTPAAPDVVVLADHPDAPAIAATLQQWHDGINDGDYDRAFAAYSTRLQQQVGADTFADGNRTSAIIAPSLVSVEDRGTGRTAIVGFRSTQDPALGPDGQDCSDWTLTWQMVRVADRWLVDAVSPRNDTPLAC